MKTPWALCYGSRGGAEDPLMKVSPLIRRGVPADEPQLLELVRQYWCFEGITGFDPANLAPLLRRLTAEPELGVVWVAEAGDELVGYLLTVNSFSLEQQGLIAEIDELFVVPAARTYGVGAALLGVAESELAEAGCVCLQLQLGKDNYGGRAFYRRHGYLERSGYELLDKRIAPPLAP
jgi:ribosomal protein S18 acetylase RimI-like enzyme